MKYGMFTKRGDALVAKAVEKAKDLIDMGKDAATVTEFVNGVLMKLATNSPVAGEAMDTVVRESVFAELNEYYEKKNG